MTKEKAANASIMIDVLPDGKTFVGNLEVPIRDMEGVLKKMAAERQTDRVIINADEATPYAPVMAAMEAARNSGLENIALATEMDKSAPQTDEEGRPRKVEVQK
jgi:biopolymer transport protein ExbD